MPYADRPAGHLLVPEPCASLLKQHNANDKKGKAASKDEDEDEDEEGDAEEED